MLIKMEVESSYTGKLQVNVVTRENVPVRDATVTIAASDSPNNIIERLTTNSSGQTETIDSRPYFIWRVSAKGSGRRN